MSPSWWNRFPRSKSRPAPRGRRARPSLEALDERLLLTIFTNFDNGQLQVTDNNLADVVALDHSGTTTFINGSSFPDSLISNGILIRVGSGVGIEDKVNILATVKPVTVDGQFDVDAVSLGKNHSMQGIRAPVTLIDLGASGLTNSFHDYDLTLDDSADTFARNVALSSANGLRTITDLAPTTISYDDVALHNLTIDGGSGGNTFSVLHTPTDGIGGFTDLNTGTGNDTVNVLGTDGEPGGGVFGEALSGGGDLLIHNQGGGDTVHVGNAGSVQGLLGSVNISNTGGFTFLSVDDSADQTARTVTMRFENDSGIRTGVIEGLAPVPIRYAQNAVNFVSISAGSGGNTFTIDDTFKNGITSDTTELNTGTGSDLVFVHRTTGGLNINGQNGHDIVNISSDIFPAGSLLGIQGDIDITNAGSFTRMTVNGAADSYDRTVLMDASPINGSHEGEIDGLAPARVFYNPNDVNFINLNGGSGRDTFFIGSTAGPASIQINALGGNDTFVVGNNSNSLDDINSPLQLNGNGGFDTLIVNDQGSTSGHLIDVTATSVSRVGGAKIGYAAIDALQVNRSTAPIVFNPDPFFPQVKDLAFPKSIVAGRFAKVTGRLVDGDGDRKLTLTVDWGDGSAPTVVQPGQKPFSVKHKFATAGRYTVRVIWTDSAGASNFRDLSLTVAASRGPSGPRLARHHRA